MKVDNKNKYIYRKSRIRCVGDVFLLLGFLTNLVVIPFLAYEYVPLFLAIAMIILFSLAGIFLVFYICSNICQLILPLKRLEISAEGITYYPPFQRRKVHFIPWTIIQEVENIQTERVGHDEYGTRTVKAVDNSIILTLDNGEKIKQRYRALRYRTITNDNKILLSISDVLIFQKKKEILSVIELYYHHCFPNE